LADLEDIVLVLKTPGLKGLNVTIPYKKSIIRYLDEMDDQARETGAVNTIKISKQDERFFLKGYNTDVDGFIHSEDFSGYDHALILGTGGASSAIQYALKKLNIHYRIVSREPKPYDHLLYEDLDQEIMTRYRLIINTTPLGMFPETGFFPDIPYDLLTSDHFLYDLIYNPDLTMFLKKGMEKGCRIRNGMKMLHLQAEYAYRIWNEENYSPRQSNER
ncbi:MAG: shikimate dehydrogenase family protein, partial [Syntrophothermus sp.]